MEEEQNSPTNQVKFMHFTKLHQRVQTKYAEMQQKLLKSRSMDSLINDDGIELSTGQPWHHKKDAKHNSQAETLHTEEAIEKKIRRESVLIEEIEADDLFSRDIEMCFLEDASDCNSSDALTVPTFNIEEVFESPEEFSPKLKTNLFNDSISEGTNGSRESLGDIYIESEEVSWPPTPPPKISIRDRIGSKISAAKEKRRRKEQEKQRDKDNREKVEWHTFSKTIKQDIVNVKPTKRIKIATVTVALIEANGLQFETTDIKTRIVNCRLRLGSEKVKSKVIKSNSTKVEWLELFNLNMYDDDEMLELSLWDKEFCIGKNNIDLTAKEKDKTYKTKLKLNEGPDVEMFILLTITGTPLINTVYDAADYFNIESDIKFMKNKYAFHCINNEDGTVGSLKVIVYGAMGLVGSDCHCILELGNDRLQTQTEYRTNNPNWMKVFTFEVGDITSILEITIHDEKKTENIGKLSIALLDIKNGEKKWYALKDNLQKERAKGNNPRVLLEMTVYWNLLRASLNVISPKEEKYLEYEDKLDRHLFVHNLSRAKAVVLWVFDAFKVMKNCFEWESTKLNLIALLIWLLSVWHYKIWMFPLMLLIPFTWYRPEKYYFIDWEKQFVKYNIIEKQAAELNESEVKQEKEKEEKTTLRQKFNSIQEMVLSVQSFIGKLACFGESIKNLFNFNVPYLSCLAIFFILVISFVMFLIPIQYIFMIWGVHKFMRKILRPDRIPNNEVLDFLSRVPNDEVLRHCRELPLEDTDTA